MTYIKTYIKTIMSPVVSRTKNYGGCFSLNVFSLIFVHLLLIAVIFLPFPFIFIYTQSFF